MSTGAERIVLRRSCWRLLGAGFVVILASIPLVHVAASSKTSGAPMSASVRRLRSCLLLRKGAGGSRLGENDLDPLFWPETKYLITGESNRTALGCLDEFIKEHGERTTDSLQRALLQRDLWALFDWSTARQDHPAERRELQIALAEVLRRVALTADQIRSLPDNYSEAIKWKKFAAEYDPSNPSRPFLPADLFQPMGPWVCISAAPTATVHLEAFAARSVFLVFLHLPGGRAATFNYLHQLYIYPRPLILRTSASGSTLNLEAPQFPPGTEVALVRKMILFNDKGALMVTPITESVQLRVYHSVTPGSAYMNYLNGPSSRDQDFYEFRLSRQKLLASDNPALEPLAADYKEFSTFLSHGIDPFEMHSGGGGDLVERPHEVMRSCNSCHADSGIHSVQSREKLMPPYDEQNDPRNGDATYGALYWETETTLGNKARRYDWGLLNGYWNAPRKEALR